jgi:hypothetical protein
VPFEEVPQPVELPVVWLGVEGVPIQFATAFVSQFDPQTLDSLTLTVGQVTFPAISAATQEERQQQLENVSYVPIRPIIRLGLTPARARELVATLEANLDLLERAIKLRPSNPLEDT